MIARLLLAALLFPSAAFADDSMKEPVQKLVLNIGGKAVPMVIGKEVKIEGEFKEPTAIIEAASVRSFDIGGIRFDYPAGYNWEAERDDTSHTWTMEGPDVTLMVFRFDKGMDAGGLADAVAKRHGRNAVKTEITEMHGGREFIGWKISGKISGIPIKIRVFSIPFKQGSLIFQIVDSPGTAKEESPEFMSTMELLGKTLTISSR